MIVGRNIDHVARDHAADSAAPVHVRFSALAGRMLEPVDLFVRKGEILGLTGLIGSGYEEVPYLAFGAKRARSGTVGIEGGATIAQHDLSPRQAIDMGFALLPGDRQNESGVGSLPIVDNMLLPDVRRFFRTGFMRDGEMMREARRLGTEFEVRPNDPSLKLSALSGGNAQKVLIARWMNRSPALLLDGRRRVDVGTRQQSLLLRQAAAEGMSVICASRVSNLPKSETACSLRQAAFIASRQR